MTLRWLRNALLVAVGLTNASFRVVDYREPLGIALTAVMTLVTAVAIRMTWVLNARSRADRLRKPRPAWALRVLALLTVDPSFLDANVPERAAQYRMARRYWQEQAEARAMPTVFLDAHGNRVPPP